MFDETLKALEELKETRQLAISIELDDAGYFDRECPECHFNFKVMCSDWKELFKDEAVFCPLCAHSDTATNWNTESQNKSMVKSLESFLGAKIGNALLNDANGFNAKQRNNSFLQIRMKASGVHKDYVSVPIKTSEEMQLKIACNLCTARFAVIGSAFFCPCCAGNLVENIIDNTFNKIKGSLKNLDGIKLSITELASKDDAENICRSIVENSLSEGVAGFQAYCETVYNNLSMQPAPKNVFQRVEDGSNKWLEIFGSSYQTWLTNAEYTKLKTYFQQRHLLSHKGGIVDEEYIKKSGDNNYKAGQRLVIKGRDSLEFIQILEKLISAIRQNLIPFSKI